MELNSTPVSPRLALRILDQVLEALEVAHAAGVVHRDVTPGNILLAGGTASELLSEPGRDPGVKLVDFGIASLAERSELSAMSRALGTEAYVAPEVYDPDQQVGPAADLYGAGAVAYELLTGQRPLGRFKLPGELGVEVPEGVDALLDAMLDGEPSRRPGSAAAARRTLEKVVAAEQARAERAAEIAAASSAVPERGGGSTRRGLRPGAVMGVLLAGAAVVMVLWATLGQDRSVPQSRARGEPEGQIERGAAEASSASADELPASSAPGDVWTESAVGMRFRYAPPGEFEMGSPSSEGGRDDDERQHRVRLTRGFWMGETEVTQGQWRSVMGSNPSYFDSCGDGCPVEKVNWWEAVSYANAVSRASGLEECYRLRGCDGRPGEDMECAGVEFAGLDCAGYRLPTESEWEYAARAGTRTRFYWGDSDDEPTVKQYAWYEENADEGYWSEPHAASEGPQPAATKRANAWGLHDMSGNVREWVWDRYGEYPSGSVTDPLGSTGGSYRVRRGGSWDFTAWFCRSAYRYGYAPGPRSNDLGFRLARTAD